MTGAEKKAEISKWEEHRKSTGKLVFIGFAALIDPPREAVQEQSSNANRQGLK